jgi:hypothetical protein
MKYGIHTALLAGAALLVFPAAAYADEQKDSGQSAPGTWRISTGVNYSQGDYGEVQDTKVVSAPIAVKYRRGGFSVRVSVPYVHIDGPGSLLDTPQGRDAGFGDDSGFDDNGGSSSNSGSGSSSSNSGSGSSGSSSGSGSSGSSGSSGGSGSGGSGSSHSGGSDDSPSGSDTVTGGGTVVGVPGAANNRRSGIGDIAVSLGYSFNFGETTYFDLSARMKVPTASRAKRLGTGKVDFTVGGDLVQDIGHATVYVGGRRKFMGKPVGSTLRDTWGVGGGASYRLSGGTVIGADYDWQQSSSASNGPSSEVTGWVNFGLTRKLRMQVFASTGFTTNSTDFAGGLSLSYRLN